MEQNQEQNQPAPATPSIWSLNQRFDSFAFPRWGNLAKWHVDGNDYFYALSEMLEAARQTIMIMDWFTSPEIYLRRPPAYYPEWRLDKLLKRKAEQGVRVFVTLSNTESSSEYKSRIVKERFESLHPNISVLYHPGSILSENSQSESPAHAWCNNEKVVIVDHLRASLGSLSLSLGNWDCLNHPLADVHPVRFAKTLFPGKDYHNSKISENDGVEDFLPQKKILETPRLPCHGVSLTIVGPCVFDLEAHFIERWNFIKSLKYEKEEKYPWLDLPQFETEKQFAEHFSVLRFSPEAIGFSPGLMKAQVVRSVSEWSHDVPMESSIHSAYIEMIEEAKHFIYIENEFFISSLHSTKSEPGAPRNAIAEALVKRIIRAAKADEHFQVVVVLPELPALPGSFTDSTSQRIIMDAQWKTINRGGYSIYEEIAIAGFDPSLYIRFYHLRAYDRINAPMESYIERMESQSGIKFAQAQVALSRIWMGDSPPPSPPKPLSKKEKEKRKWSRLLSHKDRQSREFEVMPRTVDHAKEVIFTFQLAAKNVKEYEHVSDSVAHHAMWAGTSLLDERWYGKAQEERAAYVSEMIHVNSKLMIVDDRRAIIGSASINDQSQLGNRNSEIALVVEDTEEIPSEMNGQFHGATRFAATLRRMLYKEHLGLLPPQDITKPNPPTCFMRAAPFPNIDLTRTYGDIFVADPLSPSTIALWRSTAKLNTAIYSEVFKPIPSDTVQTMEQLKSSTPAENLYGRIVPEVSLQHAKLRLSQVRGHLTEMSLQFLIGETWIVSEDDRGSSGEAVKTLTEKLI